MPVAVAMAAAAEPSGTSRALDLFVTPDKSQWPPQRSRAAHMDQVDILVRVVVSQWPPQRSRAALRMQLFHFFDLPKSQWPPQRSRAAPCGCDGGRHTSYVAMAAAAEPSGTTSRP